MFLHFVRESEVVVIQGTPPFRQHDETESIAFLRLVLQTNACSQKHPRSELVRKSDLSSWDPTYHDTVIPYISAESPWHSKKYLRGFVDIGLDIPCVGMSNSSLSKIT